MNNFDRHSYHHAWHGIGYGAALVEANRLRGQAFDDFLVKPVLAAFRGLGTGLRRFAAALARHRRRVRTQRELQALSDHMLRDIGLTRGEILYVAAQLAAGVNDAPDTNPRLIEGRLQSVEAGNAANDEEATLLRQADGQCRA